MRSSLLFRNIRDLSLPEPTQFQPANKTPPHRFTVRGRRRIEPQKQGSRVLTAILGGSNPSQRAVHGSFVLFEWFSLRRPWRSEVPFVALPRWAVLGINASLESNRRALRRVKSFSKDQLEVLFRIASRARRQISAAAGSSNSRSSFHLSVVHNSK